jgi:cell wall-associated NlpC family hydrolase
VQYAYKQIGVDIPRTTFDQIKIGKPVQWGQFQPGDLIFSNKGGHVVMYVGNGKVIAAPRTGTVVQYQPVSRFKNSFVTARRVL